MAQRRHARCCLCYQSQLLGRELQPAQAQLVQRRNLLQVWHQVLNHVCMRAVLPTSASCNVVIACQINQQALGPLLCQASDRACKAGKHTSIVAAIDSSVCCRQCACFTD